MSLSISVVAQKMLSKGDFEKVDLYNGLIDNGYDVPDALVSDLTVMIEDFYNGEPVSIPEGTQMVEIEVGGEGDVMYGDGRLIALDSLPPNTIALRVYAV